MGSEAGRSVLRDGLVRALEQDRIEQRDADRVEEDR